MKNALISTLFLLQICTIMGQEPKIRHGFSDFTELRISEKNLDDSLLKADFDDYLKSILSTSSDVQVVLDSSLKYNLAFKTKLPLAFPNDLQPAHFLDSTFFICTTNPKIPAATELQVNFLLAKTRVEAETTFLSDEQRTLYFSTFVHSASYTGNIHFGDPIIFTSEYTNVFSFDNGRHLILCERRFGPDIRGSMPPGTAVSLFLERTD